MSKIKNPAKAANRKPGTIQKDKLNRMQVCPDYPFNDNWLAQLQILSNRYESLRFGPDLVSMILAKEWGLYYFLKGQEV